MMRPFNSFLAFRRNLTRSMRLQPVRLWGWLLGALTISTVLIFSEYTQYAELNAGIAGLKQRLAANRPPQEGQEALQPGIENIDSLYAEAQNRLVKADSATRKKSEEVFVAYLNDLYKSYAINNPSIDKNVSALATEGNLQRLTVRANAKLTIGQLNRLLDATQNASYRLSIIDMKLSNEGDGASGLLNASIEWLAFGSRDDAVSPNTTPPAAHRSKNTPAALSQNPDNRSPKPGVPLADAINAKKVRILER